MRSSILEIRNEYFDVKTHKNYQQPDIIVWAQECINKQTSRDYNSILWNAKESTDISVPSPTSFSIIGW